MHQGFNTFFRALLVATRWAMAPLCLGLGAALLVVMVQFGRELVHAVAGFEQMWGAEVILEVLKLVDLVLVANLLLMIISAGIEIFLPGDDADDERSPRSGIAEFAALKPRLFASISAIAAIDLLESYVNIESVDKSAVLWEIVILLAIVVSGLMLAVMGRLERRE
jgi:uncharacterized protein (TIGR00645 family)